MSLDVLCLEADSMPESPRTFSRGARSETDCPDASARTDKLLRPANCDVMLKILVGTTNCAAGTFSDVGKD